MIQEIKTLPSVFQETQIVQVKTTNNNQGPIAEAEAMEQSAQELEQLLMATPPDQKAIETAFENLYMQFNVLNNMNINDPSGIIHGLIREIGNQISDAFGLSEAGNNGQALMTIQLVESQLLPGLINALQGK